VIVLTNARTLMHALDLDGGVRPVGYALLALAWGVAVAFALRALLRARHARTVVAAARGATPSRREVNTEPPRQQVAVDSESVR